MVSFAGPRHAEAHPWEYFGSVCTAGSANCFMTIGSLASQGP